MSDIFKDMQTKVGCDYISDLPSYKRKVWQEMKRLNPADYEERQLEDFSKYVFGMSYQTLRDLSNAKPARHFTLLLTLWWCSCCPLPLLPTLPITSRR